MGRATVRSRVARLVLAGALLAALPAGAAAPSEAGWWWRAQTGVVVEVPAPPQVPEGGLYVEGAPDGPSAIAALRFLLPEGETPVALTLKTAGEQGGEDAVLLACPAGGSWIRADAGRWENRPVAACEGAGIVGSRAEDGGSWRFDLRLAAVRDGRLDLVLTPGTVQGRPEGADGSVFSVAFAPPDAETLTTQAPAGPETTPPPPYQPPLYQPPPAVGTGATPGLPPAPPEPAQPDVQDPSVLTPKSTPDTRATGTGAARDGKDARALATLVALLSVGVAGVLSRDRVVPLPASVRDGDGEREGGIGRFRRVRNAPPPPL